MARAELKSKVTLNSRPFDQTLRGLRRKARGWGRTVQRIGAAGAKAFAAVSAFGGVAVAGMAKLTDQTAKAGDEFHKMALKTGLSEEALSVLGFQAKLAGTELGTFQTAMKGIGRFAIQVGDGLSTATRGLDRMGISAEEFATASPEEALGLMADGLRRIKNPLEQAGLAQQIFGRSGQEMLPFLKQGSAALKEQAEDVRRLGGVWTKEGSAKAAKYVDQMARLKTAIAGVRNKVVLAFIDSMSGGLTRLTEKIVKFRENNGFVNWAATSAGAVNNMVETVRSGFARLTNYIAAGLLTVADAGKSVWGGMSIVAGAAWEEMTNAAALAISTIEAGFERLKGVALAAWQVIRHGSLAGAGKALDESTENAAALMRTAMDDYSRNTTKAAAEQKRLREELDKSLQAWMSGSHLAEAARDTERDQLNIARQHESIRARIAKWQAEAAKGEADRNKSAADTLASLAASTDQLKMQAGLSGPLRGVFGRPVQSRSEPQSVRSRQFKVDADTKGILMRQYKTQTTMAASLDRISRKPSLAW